MSTVNLSVHKTMGLGKRFALLGIALSLSACSSRLALPQFDDPKSYDDMYLRGVFNWWEADPSYKLTKTGVGMYTVDVQLIADGQPYDFKVADNKWSPGLNCGTDDSDGVVSLSSRIYLECDDEEVTNLRFTPSSTGLFRFHLDVTNNSRPQLYITRVSSN